MPRGSVRTHQRVASEALPTIAPEARLLSAHQRTKSLKDVLKFGSKASRLSLEKASHDPVEPALDTPVASPPPALDHAADSSPAVTRGVSAAQRMFDEGEGVAAKSSSSKREPSFKELAALEAAAAAAAAVATPEAVVQVSPAMVTTESSAVAEGQQEEEEEEQQAGENTLKDAVVAMFAARPASHVGDTEAAVPADTASEAPVETAVAAAAALPEPAVVAEEAAAAAAKPAAATTSAGAAPHRRTVSFMERMAALFDTSAVAEGLNREKPVNPAPTPATTPANAVLAVEHKRQISLSQAFRDYFVPTEAEDPAAFSPEGQYLPPAFREGRRGSENGAGAMAAAAAAASAEVEAEAAAAQKEKGAAQVEVMSAETPAKKERDAAAEEAAEAEEGDGDAGKEAVDASCTVWLSRLFSRK